MIFRNLLSTRPFIPYEAALGLTIGTIAAIKLPSNLQMLEISLNLSPETLFFAGIAGSLFLLKTDYQLPILFKTPLKNRIVQYFLENVQIGIFQISMMYIITYVAFRAMNSSTSPKEIAVLVGSIYVLHRVFKSALDLGRWLRSIHDTNSKAYDP
ncbi:MAG: hypothetical protein JSR58_07305 [Verrucomicrobia bacterium]|nr:hypothetical protein [Verrucomicrobiota bacterium]